MNPTTDELRQSIIPDPGLLAIMRGNKEQELNPEAMERYMKNIEQAMKAGVSIAEILAPMPSYFRQLLAFRLFGIEHRN